MRRIFPLFFTLILFLAPVLAQAAKINVVSFNVESDADTEPIMVADDIGRIGRAHLWGLTEVESDQAMGKFIEAMKNSYRSGEFRYFLSRSGNYSGRNRLDDRIAIVYSSRTFRLLETRELHFIRVKSDGSQNPGLRATLVGRFLHKDTGRDFLFAVNHLKCCDKGVDTRLRQIKLFLNWVEQQNLPTIAVGSWNTPVEIEKMNQTKSIDFQTLLGRSFLGWIEPSNPIKTQCSDTANDMLDHIFLNSDLIQIWQPSVKILFTKDNYCDVEHLGTSDHRPLLASFDIK